MIGSHLMNRLGYSGRGCGAIKLPGVKSLFANVVLAVEPTQLAESSDLEVIFAHVGSKTIFHFLHLRVSTTTFELINRLHQLLSIRLIKSILVYEINYKLGFQMTHIEAKSLDKWLRYELKSAPSKP